MTEAQLSIIYYLLSQTPPDVYIQAVKDGALDPDEIADATNALAAAAGDTPLLSPEEIQDLRDEQNEVVDGL